MSSEARSKRLEITLISGQDLPPIARNLTTYAVAWLKPDHKLTTQIDHHGHTNPKWDHKFVYHLDRSFSNSDTATTVTFEIYNVGWLRDFLVGSAQIVVSNLLEKRSKNHRPFVVQLRRPTTGILQGVLNVGVNLTDRSNDNVNVGRNVLSCDSIDKIGLVENDDRKMNGENKLERSRSERTAKFEDFLIADENGDHRPFLSRSKSGCSMTQIGSVNSMMRPLPSEVVATLKDGMYSTGGDDIGSYVFSVGTVEREPRNDEKGLNAKVAKWRLAAMNDKTPVVDDRRLKSSDHHQRRKKGERGGGGGLFSCFGNIKGREFSFVCGNNEPTKRKKRKPRV